MDVCSVCELFDCETQRLSLSSDAFCETTPIKFVFVLVPSCFEHASNLSVHIGYLELQAQGVYFLYAGEWMGEYCESGTWSCLHDLFSPYFVMYKGSISKKGPEISFCTSPTNGELLLEEYVFNRPKFRILDKCLVILSRCGLSEEGEYLFRMHPFCFSCAEVIFI